MKSVIVAMLMTLLLSGCMYHRVSRTVLVHPGTQDVKVCKSTFGVAIFVPYWAPSGNCISELKALGYIEGSEL